MHYHGRPYNPESSSEGNFSLFEASGLSPKLQLPLYIAFCIYLTCVLWRACVVQIVGNPLKINDY